jgi:hypothetical protein
MSLTLARRDPTYEDLATKFLEHFAYISTAIHERGLWDEQDGFYYDVLQIDGGERLPLRVRSIVGLLPLAATTTLGRETLERLSGFAERLQWFVAHKPHFAANMAHVYTRDGREGRLLSIVSPERPPRILARVLDETEFLSPHGIRSLSARHRAEPFTLAVGDVRASVGYEPAESTTGLFGGNSNWRGPVWFPVNYVVLEGLRRFARYFGDDVRVECPTGSGRQLTLSEVADELAGRLIGLFLAGPDGRRPVVGDAERFRSDPAWRGLIPFHEYFHGDTGAGLGASHQTGWTGLVADLILGRPPAPTAPAPALAPAAG